MQGWYSIRKINQCNINKLKKKNHMIISIDAGKACDKIQYSFMKRSEKRNSGNFLNLIKSFYKNPTANIILNGERLNVLPLRE